MAKNRKKKWRPLRRDIYDKGNAKNLDENRNSKLKIQNKTCL